MIIKVLAVKDMKASIYLRPFFQQTKAEAMRSFELMANEGEHIISKFPNDFRLHVIADFDTDTGRITPLTDFEDLGAAADYKKQAPQAPLPFENRQ